MSMDLYKNVKVVQLLNEAQDGASVAVATGTCVSISAYNKRCQVFAHAHWATAGAGDDTCTIVIQKCTSAAAAGATTVDTITLTGTNAADATASDEIAIDLEGLGNTYTHLRAVCTFNQDGSAQETSVSVVLVAGYAANEVN